jgi:outer membrane autotransporter protein
MIVPIFGPLIQNGTTFDIIRATGGGTITDNSTVPTNSAVISFTNSVVGTNILRLTTLRNSFTSLASTANTQSLGGALDAISQQSLASINPDIFALFNQLEMIPTQLAVDQALESLLPPLNYSEVAGAHMSMDAVFSTVVKRFAKGDRHQHYGYNAGDYCHGGPTGNWVNVLAANQNQDELNGIDGYKARAAGFIVGSDWDICDFYGIGVSASFARVHTTDKAVAPKDQLINSYQGTLYGWFEPVENWYIDWMLAGAALKYHTFHHIAVGNVVNTAISDFNGHQYGGQVDVGYVFANNGYYISPLMRLKYTHLALDSYEEKEMGGVGLSVQGQDYDEFTFGAGARVATQFTCQQVNYIPEISALILHDFANDGQTSIAAFSGGGPNFTTNGLIPGSTIVDLSAAMIVQQNRAVWMMKYDAQLREKFVSNTLFLEGYYYW